MIPPGPRLRDAAARLRALGRPTGDTLAAILLYHRIAEPEDDPFRLCVSPEHFEDQLERVRATYRVATLEEVVAGLDQPPGQAPCVAVTFDDGYLDNLEVAEPIASRLDVPLTLFVTVQPVLSGTRFWWDELAERILQATGFGELSLTIGSRRRRFPVASPGERARTCVKLHGLLRTLAVAERAAVLDQLPALGHDERVRPLTAEELRRLARRPGVKVGSHTLTHPALTSVDAAARERELVESRRELERVLGDTVDLVSYPYGRGADLDEEVVRCAAEAGYTAACTTVQRQVTSTSRRLALPRLTVADTSGDELLRVLRGVVPPR